MQERSTPNIDRAHRHPAWCNTQLCALRDGVDVDHVSTPAGPDVNDLSMSLQLVATDELRFDDEPLITSLRVEATSRTLAGDPILGWLSLGEVRELRDQLSALLTSAEAAELDDPGYFCGGAS